MVITSLRQGKRAERINVFIDDEFAAAVSINIVAKFALHKGLELDDAKWQNILDEELTLYLYYSAIKQIGSRPRSERELRMFLTKKANKVMPEGKSTILILERVFDRLKTENLVNDLDFAYWFLDNRISFKSKSKLEITAELKGKGVSNSDIAQVIEAHFPKDQDEESIRQIWAKKYSRVDPASLKLDRKALNKVLSYFQRKGFNFSLVQRTIFGDN